METITMNNIKRKHYFFLNPHDSYALTKCPKCQDKTKLRKFPLVINVEPSQILVLNKKCRYCTTCDLIMAKKSEIESLMAYSFERIDPSVVGNKYVVFGTLDKYIETASFSKEFMEQINIFKDVIDFEILPGGWYRDEK